MKVTSTHDPHYMEVSGKVTHCRRYNRSTDRSISPNGKWLTGIRNASHKPQTSFSGRRTVHNLYKNSVQVFICTYICGGSSWAILFWFRVPVEKWEVSVYKTFAPPEC